MYIYIHVYHIYEYNMYVVIYHVYRAKSSKITKFAIAAKELFIEITKLKNMLSYDNSIEHV